MSRIQELKGNHFRARIYLTMIPESKVETMTSQYRELNIPGEDERRDSMPVVRLVPNDVAGLGISSLEHQNDSSRLKLDGPATSGADDPSAERSDSYSFDRPQLLSANTEDLTSSLTTTGASTGGLSPPLPPLLPLLYPAFRWKGIASTDGISLYRWAQDRCRDLHCYRPLK